MFLAFSIKRVAQTIYPFPLKSPRGGDPYKFLRIEIEKLVTTVKLVFTRRVSKHGTIKHCSFTLRFPSHTIGGYVVYFLKLQVSEKRHLVS